MPSYQYTDSHAKDKTVSPTVLSLTWESPLGKTVFILRRGPGVEIFQPHSALWIVLFEFTMGLLPDAWNCGLRMRRECRERFPRNWLQRKPLVSDPGMHHGTCVKHVPWSMSGSLTGRGGENVPGIPGACTTRNFMYLVRGLLHLLYFDLFLLKLKREYQQNPSYLMLIVGTLVLYSLSCAGTLKPGEPGVR